MYCCLMKLLGFALMIGYSFSKEKQDPHLKGKVAAESRRVSSNIAKIACELHENQKAKEES